MTVEEEIHRDAIACWRKIYCQWCNIECVGVEHPDFKGCKMPLKVPDEKFLDENIYVIASAGEKPIKIVLEGEKTLIEHSEY